ncbi:hypothetical protein BOX15_Mlig032503g1, partial [Macrostomum lignano]
SLYARIFLREALSMANQTDLLDAVRAALSNADADKLLPLCRKLESNVVIIINGHEQSVAHHVAALLNGIRCVEALIKKLGPGCLTCINKSYNTHVHLAALYQEQDWMKVIHRALGSDCFHQPGQFQRTAIHWAAENKLSNSSLKWLVKKLGTACLSVRDEHGNTPVHLAALCQGEDSMQFFKSVLGSDCFHQPGQFQRSAIHWAATNGVNNATWKWLVSDCGSDCLTVKDEHENTPIHLAAWRQGEESIKICAAQLGFECFHQEGQHGRTAVHFAAMNELYNSSLEVLISICGPKCLSVKDSYGTTPAHLAAQYKDLDSLRLVVKSLGDSVFELVDNEGKTVADYAENNAEHRHRMLQWIQEYRRQQQSLPAKMDDLQLQKQQQESPNKDGQRPAKKLKIDPNFTKWDFLLDGQGKKQKIGEGAFGKVYKALTDKHQTVAVKIVYLQANGGTESVNAAIERELFEVSILRGMQHQNILKFIKAERYKKRMLSIFTELIAGQSLYDLMQKQQKPFDESAVKDFSRQICTALNYLHNRDPATLHRDIKCSNIMLNHKGVIKLIDFGLAKEILTSIVGSYTFCGTVCFMAPELFSNETTIVYSPKSDVWAFGCTIFEMLTMDPPNGELDFTLIPDRIINCAMPDLPRSVSGSLWDFYLRCVLRDPRGRADTEELLQHEFLSDG